jgi:hypothetical protein
VQVAWPLICDSYYIRERGGFAEKDRENVRTLLWQTVNDDAQWKEHLSDCRVLTKLTPKLKLVRQAGPPRDKQAPSRIELRKLKLSAMKNSGAKYGGADQPSPMSGQVVQRSSADSKFWNDRKADFLVSVGRFADLTAYWNGGAAKWRLAQGSNGQFEAASMKAATGLNGLGANAGREPLHLWLTFLREKGHGYKVTGNQACTEIEWDAGVKDGIPLHQIRLEQRYTEGDEWRKVYRRTRNGKLIRLSPGRVEEQDG